MGAAQGAEHLLSLWLGAVSSLCTCFSVTVDFTGVSWKEFEFGLLKPSWGSEGCSQTSEVSWG